MGIFKGLTELIAGDGLIDLTDKAIKGLDKAIAAREKKIEEKIQSFLEANPDHCHLFASQVRNKLKETYYIYDHQKEVRYLIKGELLSLKHHLHVYDASGKTELATVTEKLIAIRSPFSVDSNPKDFVIEVGGKPVGKVKTKGSFTKQKFDITFNDWTVIGDVFGKEYKVLDKNKNIIMVASKQYAYINDTYYVDITNPKDELYCVLILLALDASTITKSDETKKAIKKKIRF